MSGHINVRSIVTKIDQIRVCLQDSNIDIFSVSETWLQPHLGIKLVELQGFKTFRLDRGSHNKRKMGGGLLAYVKTKHAVNCELLGDLDRTSEDIEAQLVLVRRPHCTNIVTCNVYIDRVAET